MNTTIYEANHPPAFYEGMPLHALNRSGKPFAPYVYKISWTAHDIHYIGASFRAGCHPTWLFNRSIGSRGYFTSSKYVRQYVECFGDPDKIIIMSIHGSVQETILAEHEQLVLNDAAKSAHYLNRTNNYGLSAPPNTGFVIARLRGTSDPYTYIHPDCYDPTIHETAGSGRVVAVDTWTGKNVSVPVDDFYSSDRYVRGSCNHLPVIDTDTGQTMLIHTDIYHSSDRYISVSHGQVSVICKSTGDVVRITTDEYRTHKDRYLHWGTGQTVAIDKLTQSNVKITMEEYHSNPDRYTHASTGRVFVTDNITGEPTFVTSEHYAINKSQYTRHTSDIVVVLNNTTQQHEAVPVDEYYINRDMYTTVSKGKLAVIQKSTGNMVFIDKNEYRVNKQLYARFAEGKVSAKLISTGESVMVDSVEFHTNRHLYRAHSEGNAPVTKGKSPHVNDDGDLQYFIKGQAPAGYVTARRIYHMVDGSVKWNKESLIKDFPGQYYPTAKWYDSHIDELIQLPSVIGRANPERYHQCRSETYQKFKRSMKR